MDFTEQATRFFSKDIYAKKCGCVIELAEENHAVCSFAITPDHDNAAGFVMGGAIFTLADFCFAVAANTNRTITVAANSNISFLNASKGTKLTAEANCLKDGNKMCFYIIKVSDDLGTAIAEITVSGYRKSQ